MLEEQRTAANNGDLFAMYAVGMENYHKGEYAEALKYIEDAADRTFNKAMLAAIYLRHKLALAARDLLAWDNVSKHCEKMFYWVRYVLNLGETSDADMFTQEEYDKVYRKGLDALYFGGMASYYLQDYQAAVEASEGLQTDRLQILHAASLFQILTTADMLKQVFEEQKLIESKSFFLACGG